MLCEDQVGEVLRLNHKLQCFMSDASTIKAMYRHLPPRPVALVWRVFSRPVRVMHHHNHKYLVRGTRTLIRALLQAHEAAWVGKSHPNRFSMVFFGRLPSRSTRLRVLPRTFHWWSLARKSLVASLTSGVFGTHGVALARVRCSRGGLLEPEYGDSFGVGSKC